MSLFLTSVRIDVNRSERSWKDIFKRPVSVSRESRDVPLRTIMEVRFTQLSRKTFQNHRFGAPQKKKEGLRSRVDFIVLARGLKRIQVNTNIQANKDEEDQGGLPLLSRIFAINHSAWIAFSPQSFQLYNYRKNTIRLYLPGVPLRNPLEDRTSAFFKKYFCDAPFLEDGRPCCLYDILGIGSEEWPLKHMPHNK